MQPGVIDYNLAYNVATDTERRDNYYNFHDKLVETTSTLDDEAFLELGCKPTAFQARGHIYMVWEPLCRDRCVEEITEMSWQRIVDGVVKRCNDQMLMNYKWWKHVQILVIHDYVPKGKLSSSAGSSILSTDS